MIAKLLEVLLGVYVEIRRAGRLVDCGILTKVENSFALLDFDGEPSSFVCVSEITHVNYDDMFEHVSLILEPHEFEVWDVDTDAADAAAALLPKGYVDWDEEYAEALQVAKTVSMEIIVDNGDVFYRKATCGCYIEDAESHPCSCGLCKTHAAAMQ